MGDETYNAYASERRRALGLAPFQRHSTTSRQAATAIEASLGKLQTAVLDFVRDRGPTGATDEEMQRALNMNPSTQRPRRVELMRNGLIVKSPAGRQTASGRMAAVWIANNGG
jgi:hypothetical protein